MKKRYFLWTILLMITLPTLTLISYNTYQRFKENKRRKTILLKRTTAWQKLHRRLAEEISGFEGKVSLVVKDLKTSWGIYFYEEEIFPSASLVKVPIMVACFLAEEKGKIKLTDKIRMKTEDKVGGAGILKFYPPGSQFSVERLIGLMIYESDNTATNILIKHLGMDNLNRVFKEMGLKKTNLIRRVADYRARDKEGKENYTTAKDIALILEKLYRGEIINNENRKRALWFLRLQRINDRIPKYLNSEVVVAHKTGLERGICHDAGIVFTPHGDYLIVVLTQHTNRTSSLAKEFIAKVSLCVYNYFKELD